MPAKPRVNAPATTADSSAFFWLALAMSVNAGGRPAVTAVLSWLAAVLARATVLAGSRLAPRPGGGFPPRTSHATLRAALCCFFRGGLRPEEQWGILTPHPQCFAPLARPALRAAGTHACALHPKGRGSGCSSLTTGLTSNPTLSLPAHSRRRLAAHSRFAARFGRLVIEVAFRLCGGPPVRGGVRRPRLGVRCGAGCCACRVVIEVVGWSSGRPWGAFDQPARDRSHVLVVRGRRGVVRAVW